MNESSDALPPDFVGRILGALGFGMLLGLGMLSLLTWSIRGLQQTNLAIARPTRGFTAGLLPVIVLGTLASMAVAGGATWIRLQPIGNPWRKAMLAIIAGSGSFVLALLTWPIDRAFGRPGLLGLVAFCGLACLLLGRRRSARTVA